MPLLKFLILAIVAVEVTVQLLAVPINVHPALTGMVIVLPVVMGTPVAISVPAVKQLTQYACFASRLLVLTT